MNNEIDIMYQYQEPPLQMEHKPNIKTIELSTCGNIIMVSFGVCYEHRSVGSLGLKERRIKMKELQTITEYQLLYYARQELSRRIDALKDEIIRGKTTQALKRTESLLGRYTEQWSEITKRMAEINNEYAE